MHSGFSLRPAPSLHEKHFSSSNDTLPLTTLHPPGLPVHLPDRSKMFRGFGGSASYLDPYWRKPSSTRSDGVPHFKDNYSFSSRLVETKKIKSYLRLFMPGQYQLWTCIFSKVIFHRESPHQPVQDQRLLCPCSSVLMTALLRQKLLKTLFSF